MIGSHGIRVGCLSTAVPSKRRKVGPLPLTTTISPSSRKTTSLVWERIAGMSEATKYSPSPTPTTSGGPLRAATITSGSSAEITTRA